MKSRRVGGATYQVPIEVPFGASRAQHFKKAASARKGSPMADSLANELIDAYNNTGSAVKKREEIIKWSINRAFAHLRCNQTNSDKENFSSANSDSRPTVLEHTEEPISKRLMQVGLYVPKYTILFRVVQQR